MEIWNESLSQPDTPLPHPECLKTSNLSVSRRVTPDEGPSLETSKFSLYFSGSCIPINESLAFLYQVAILSAALGLA